ncbi:hypothetical protein AB0F93_23485, partial [Micromonospora tulbaghiae]
MDAEPATDIRPCAHCGRDVPQRVGAGRPFRYCRDNDGACQRAARNSRMRHRNSPGLPGQVARTWEAVDRLDQIVETLTEALHAELSPAGVERQLAELRAETSAQVAANVIPDRSVHLHVLVGRDETLLLHIGRRRT